MECTMQLCDSKVQQQYQMETTMLQYSDQKKPAFFRVMSPELFFEAEAMDTENVLGALNNSVDLDAELEALLTEGDMPAASQAAK